MCKDKSLSNEHMASFSPYRCAIFLHGVSHLVVLVPPSLPRKETLLAHVKVETLQTAISAIKKMHK